MRLLKERSWTAILLYTVTITALLSCLSNLTTLTLIQFVNISSNWKLLELIFLLIGIEKKHCDGGTYFISLYVCLFYTLWCNLNNKQVAKKFFNTLKNPNFFFLLRGENIFDTFLDAFCNLYVLPHFSRLFLPLKKSFLKSLLKNQNFKYPFCRSESLLCFLICWEQFN